MPFHPIPTIVIFTHFPIFPENEDDEEKQEIPLPNVKTVVLAKVIEFCKQYQTEKMSEIEKPLRSAVMGEVVQEWYANFVNVEQEILFELILAANYMDIKVSEQHPPTHIQFLN
tara:strand:+ start:201 stop:542 length:342 start_codon:yes stop_codon:yes gene_type:complete